MSAPSQLLNEKIGVKTGFYFYSFDLIPRLVIHVSCVFFLGEKEQVILSLTYLNLSGMLLLASGLLPKLLSNPSLL